MPRVSTLNYRSVSMSSANSAPETTESTELLV